MVRSAGVEPTMASESGQIDVHKHQLMESN